MTADDRPERPASSEEAFARMSMSAKELSQLSPELTDELGVALSEACRRAGLAGAPNNQLIGRLILEEVSRTLRLPVLVDVDKR